MPEEFEIAALFQQLSLLSTLIRHENETFQLKTLNKPDEIENARLAFCFVCTKINLQKEIFENDGVTKKSYKKRVITCPRFSKMTRKHLMGF